MMIPHFDIEERSRFLNLSTSIRKTGHEIFELRTRTVNSGLKTVGLNATRETVLKIINKVQVQI